MRELTMNELEQVDGAVLPVLVYLALQIAGSSLIRIGVKAAVTTVVATVVGPTAYNAVKN